jgi:trk system potassium uptake protein TrkH
MRNALLKVLGLLCVIYGISMLPPIAVSLIYGDGNTIYFLGIGVAGLVLGMAVFFLSPPANQHLPGRSGFLIVAVAWFFVSLLGAVPFVLIGKFDVVTAIFEAASGFTTTGSTALVGLDYLPKSLLLYRQEMQWLGGIGVVVAAIALMPMLGIGGMQLMKAETTGPAKSDKLRPRIKHTAQALWRLYLFLTIACALCYWFAGMPAFDAIAHSFSTVSTGGYAIYDASFGYYQSPQIETVAIVFMILGSLNFALHFRAWSQLSVEPYTSNSEARAFLVTILALSVFIAAALFLETDVTLSHAFRISIFQVVSVITTTGFVTDDFSVWPTLLPVLLIFISFVGGCAGSTAGGMKVIRFQIMTRQAGIEIQRLIHPRLVRPLRIGQDIIDDSVVRAVWAFFTVYAFVFVILMLAMMWFGLDQVSAFAAVATCINNLGPGLGEVAWNFDTVSDPIKLIGAFACILGRLEVLTIFLLFTPEFWRG